MAKELTIKEKLQALYDLQQIDSEIDQIAILKGELPMEVSDLEDEIEGLKTRIQKLQGAVEDLKDKTSNHHANIQEAELLIAKYEKQMDNVKNNREYDALTKEIEMQRLEIQLSKKRIREGESFLVSKEETLQAAEEKLEKKSTTLEQKKVELTEIIAKTEKDEEKLKKKSEKAKKGIEDRLLKAYTKIRGAYRNGLAVVPVSRQSCGGCFNKIPPQVQIDIRAQKKVIACEHCGRVLVDNEIAGIFEDTEE